VDERDEERKRDPDADEEEEEEEGGRLGELLAGDSEPVAPSRSTVEEADGRKRGSAAEAASLERSPVRVDLGGGRWWG
jgi:hypothetical protein